MFAYRLIKRICAWIISRHRIFLHRVDQVFITLDPICWLINVIQKIKKLLLTSWNVLINIKLYMRHFDNTGDIYKSPSLHSTHYSVAAITMYLTSCWNEQIWPYCIRWLSQTLHVHAPCCHTVHTGRQVSAFCLHFLLADFNCDAFWWMDGEINGILF